MRYNIRKDFVDWRF